MGAVADIRRVRLNSIEKAITAFGSIADEEMIEILHALADASDGGTRSHLLDVMTIDMRADAALHLENGTAKSAMAYEDLAKQITSCARELEILDGEG